MSSQSFHTQHLQRRFIRIVLAIVAIGLVIGTPLLVFDDLRLNIAHQLALAPGKDAEKLVDGDEGAVLVVLPLGEYDGIGREQYRYEAAYIARPSEGGMTLTDVETDETVLVPVTELAFIAADAGGENILFRGPSAENADDDAAVVVNRDDASLRVLPEGETVPALPGDWETPTWQKVTGTCDRVSPHECFIACYNRAEIVNYLAGDWQVDVQVYGDFKVSEPLYRGNGLWPTLGFAHDDTWLYMQNETGVYRIEIPQSLLDYKPLATPAGTAQTD